MSKACLSYIILTLIIYVSPIGLVLAYAETQAVFSQTKPIGGSLPAEIQCSLTCQYHRANDQLTLQALYLIKKVKEIDAEEDEGKVRKSVGAFCTSDLSLAACKNRYKSFQTFALLQIRQSMGKNEDQIALLAHGRQEDGSFQSGEYVGISQVAEQGGNYVPDVPTLDDLQKKYESMNKNQKNPPLYTQTQFKKWSESLILNNPKARLIEFTSQPVSDNPHSITNRTGAPVSVYMKKTSPNRSATPISKKESEVYDRSIVEIKKAVNGSNYVESVELVFPKSVLGQGNGQGSEDELSYRAFTEARSEIINTVKESWKKEGLLNKEIKPNRSPSESKVSQVDGTSGTSSMKLAHDQEKLVLPPGSENRKQFIRYDIHDLLDSTERISQELD